MDIRTLVFVTAVVSLLLPLTIWAALRRLHRQSVVWWCGGAVIAGLGGVLIGLRGSIPDVFSFVLGNTALLFGNLMRVRGLYEEAQPEALPERWGWPALFPVLAFAVGIHITMEADRLAELRLLARLGISALLALTAVLAWRIYRQQRSVNALAIAVAAAVVTLSFGVHMALTWAGMEDNGPLTNTLAAKAVASTFLLYSVASNFSFAGMALDNHAQRCLLEAHQQGVADGQAHFQERLQELEQEAGSAAIAGSLAHELSQPFTSILTNAQLSRRVVVQRDDAQAMPADIVDNIESSARRALDILERLPHATEPTTDLQASADVVEAVDAAQDLVRDRLWALNVTLQWVPPERQMTCRGHRVHLIQVMHNLLVNALQAMEGQPQRLLTILVGVDGNKAVIEVIDSGCGIAPDHAQQLGNPFFTTKANGLGMGLNICRTIVAQVGGRLELQANRSTPGATARLEWPLHSPGGAA